MKIAIIGGGVAGLTVASKLSKRHDITIIEMGDRVGKKIMASGNGRCNLSNKEFTPSKYNDQKVKEIFKTTSQKAMLEYIKSLPIALTDEDGRIYPFTKQSSTVLDALRSKCKVNGAIEKTGVKVERITKQKNKFTLLYSNHLEEDYDLVVLANGSDIMTKEYNGYSLFNQLGLEYSEFKPAIVPIECESYILKGLNGIRAYGELKYGKHTEKGEILFRNYGISGIPTLIISSYIARGENAELTLSLIPEDMKAEIKEQLKGSKLSTLETLSGVFNKIIANNVLEKVQGLHKEMFDDALINKVIKELSNIKLTNVKTLGKQEAQVGVGGVSLDEVDLKTFELKKHKNIYLIGEALNVDGICGGYNISFAMISALSAAKSISKK